MRIGLDFDNTIIRYDEVFLAEAKRRGLVAPEFRGTKQAVRDTIRLLPSGEVAWQQLQGHVLFYHLCGPAIQPCHSILCQRSATLV